MSYLFAQSQLRTLPAIPPPLGVVKEEMVVLVVLVCRHCGAVGAAVRFLKRFCFGVHLLALLLEEGPYGGEKSIPQALVSRVKCTLAGSVAGLPVRGGKKNAPYAHTPHGGGETEKFNLLFFDLRGAGGAFEDIEKIENMGVA